MKLERTFDIEVIKSVICNPEIARDIYEGEPSIPIHESVYYLIGKENEEVIGIVAFIQMNPISWNPHIAVLPQFRGMGTELMNLGVKWMFENTVCRKVIAFPPLYNQKMIRVFEKCGFKQEGYSPDSFMFKGKIYDRLLLGIGKD
jgi:diamine N-acetyltransferase